MRVNGTVITFSNAAVAGVQFLQFLWIAKMYGAEDLAIFSLTAGVFAPLGAFMSTGQRFVILAEVASNRGGPAAHLALRVGSILVLLLCCLIYLAVSPNSSFRLLGILTAVAFYRIVDGIAELQLSARQIAGQRVGYIKLAFARVLPIPIACIAAVVIQFGVVEFLWFCAAAAFVLYVLGLESRFRFAWRDLNVKAIHWRPVSSAFVTILPIGSAASLDSLAIVLPRYFLAALGTLEQVASYAIFTQLSAIIGVIAVSRVQADLRPYALLMRDAPEKILRKVVNALSVIGLAVILLGSLLAILPTSLLSTIFGEWYIGQSWMLAFLPAIALMWYAGGYLGYVLAVIKTRFAMLSLSILVLGLVCSGLSIGLLLPFDYLDLTLGTMGLAFSARFFCASFVLARRG